LTCQHKATSQQPRYKVARGDSSPGRHLATRAIYASPQLKMTAGEMSVEVDSRERLTWTPGVGTGCAWPSTRAGHPDEHLACRGVAAGEQPLVGPWGPASRGGRGQLRPDPHDVGTSTDHRPPHVRLLEAVQVNAHSLRSPRGGCDCDLPPRSSSSCTELDDTLGGLVSEMSGESKRCLKRFMRLELWMTIS
jgi:hypothetical protein